MKNKYINYAHIFKNGEVLKNNCGSDYQVIDANNQNKVLFERVTDREKVIGINPKMFHKKNEDGKISDVLEWAYGKYCVL